MPRGVRGRKWWPHAADGAPQGEDRPAQSRAGVISAAITAPRCPQGRDLRAGRGHRYSCLVVVLERVVVVPPSGSVSVFIWVSVLPAIPSRWMSFSVTVLPFSSISLWIVTSR